MSSYDGCERVNQLGMFKVVPRKIFQISCFYKKLKNTLLIGLLMRSLYLFGKKYIENREIKLNLFVHRVKPWFYAEQIAIRD